MMPTYTCWATEETLPAHVREQVARTLTDIHHEIAVAARFSVQVVFTSLAPGSVFIGGRPADPRHVWIRADIRAGRSEEQKRGMLEAIGTRIGHLLGVPAEEVWVYINELPRENFTEYGQIGPQPGQEQQWFSALPDELKQRMQSRA